MIKLTEPTPEPTKTGVRWRVRYKPTPGAPYTKKTVPGVTGQSKADKKRVRDWCDAFEKQLNGHKSSAPDSFDALWELHIETRCAELSEKVKKEYRHATKNQIDAILKPKKASDITDENFESFLNTMRDNGLSPSTARRYAMNLCTFLKWCRDIKRVPNVIVPHSDVFVRVSKKAAQTKRGRHLNVIEHERLKAQIDQMYPDVAEQYKWICDVMWFSGLRLGEAMQLSWDDDADLCIRQDRKRWFVYFDPDSHKSKRNELIPVLEDWQAALKKHVPASEQYGPVCPMPHTLDTVSDKISAACKAAGLWFKKSKGISLTAHCYRKAFCQRMADAGMPIDDLAMFTRSNRKTLEEFYVENNIDALARRADALCLKPKRKAAK